MKKLSKKKLSRLILITLVVFSMFTITASAKMLKEYSSGTYVKSTHPDIWRYVGYVSVRGEDWIKNGSSWNYPKFSRITYQVPGKADKVQQVNSEGPDDRLARRRTIEVKDSLFPIAPKTKALWRIDLSARNVKPGDPVPYSAKGLY